MKPEETMYKVIKSRWSLKTPYIRSKVATIEQNEN